MGITSGIVPPDPGPVPASGKADDRGWEARLRRWKKWLRLRSRREAAEDGLREVADPAAVRAVWNVFVTGRDAEPMRAVTLLGQIPSRSASRGLALLAACGSTNPVRQAAIQTLRWRDPMDFADLLIGMLRDPIRYDLHPVGGPGRAGSLTLRGRDHDLRLIFAPPPPPDLLVMPGEDVLLDPEGGPILFRHTDTTGLPFAWVDEHGFVFASGAFIPPHVPVTIALGDMLRENAKAAAAAQMQLRSHAVALQARNAAIHSANSRIVQILTEVTGEALPVEREAWEAWWSRRAGRTRRLETDRPRPVLTEVVPPVYLPGVVGGLAFDPVHGYFVLAPIRR
ncbi:MAG: hypothetical protein U0790_04675 [Isosphaeraceae bacterium]